MLEQNKHWEKKANGWVFISHSSDDYQDVKIVRNYLEESGFSALMFYLKSLEDPKKRKLTQKLINWEIEKRNIFVFCQSKSSKASKWVQDEIAYVKSFPEKIYVEINMEKLKYEKCTQLSKLDKLMKRSTLFFSYSHQDKEFILKFRDFFISEGFSVWIDAKIKWGENIVDEINDALKESSKNGYILYFISKNSILSEWTKYEFQSALALGASILPIIIDDVDVSNISWLNNLKYLHIDLENFEEKKRELLFELKRLNQT